jgi:hypothetical protein
LVIPPEEEFDTYQLNPWLEPDYGTSQVGVMSFDLWDERGVSNLELQAEILYHPDGVRLRLCALGCSMADGEAR